MDTDGVNRSLNGQGSLERAVMAWTCVRKAERDCSRHMVAFTVRGRNTHIALTLFARESRLLRWRGTSVADVDDASETGVRVVARSTRARVAKPSMLPSTLAFGARRALASSLSGHEPRSRGRVRPPAAFARPGAAEPHPRRRTRGDPMALPIVVPCCTRTTHVAITADDSGKLCGLLRFLLHSPFSDAAR